MDGTTEQTSTRGELSRESYPDDWPRGEVPEGRYAGGERSPIVWVLLCAGCAGFAPFTTEDYDGYLSARCAGCGRWSRECHRFRAYIDSASGCSCDRHGEPMVGDQAARHAVECCLCGGTGCWECAEGLVIAP